MNEISKQIIEVGKLIGKKVYLLHHDIINNDYYSDTEIPVNFTVSDFEFYGYNILDGTIELIDIVLAKDYENYYIVIFKDL